MSKEIRFSTRPKAMPEADKWVEKREPVRSKKENVKPKRLTIDIDPTLHRELKISCVARDIQIADLIRSLIKRELEKQEAAA